MTLPELIEKVEGASGPDRELDAQIWCWLNGRDFPEPPYTQELFRDRYKPELGTSEQGTGAGILLQSYKDNAPRYSASLDAAMSLVPRDWHMDLRGLNDSWWCGLNETAYGTKGDVTGQAATPALALTAACLRCRKEGL